MRRLLSATLALSLLGGSAAVASPYDHGNQGYDRGYGDQGYGGRYDNQDRSDNYRGYRGNNNGAVVAGIGFLALAAILASQNHHQHQGWYHRDGGRYGDDRGYNRGYGSEYGGRHDGYGDNGGYNRAYGSGYGNGYYGHGYNERRY